MPANPDISIDYEIEILERCITALVTLEAAVTEFDENSGADRVIQYLAQRFESVIARIYNA